MRQDQLILQIITLMDKVSIVLEFLTKAAQGQSNEVIYEDPGQTNSHSRSVKCCTRLTTCCVLLGRARCCSVLLSAAQCCPAFSDGDQKCWIDYLKLRMPSLRMALSCFNSYGALFRRTQSSRNVCRNVWFVWQPQTEQHWTRLSKGLQMLGAAGGNVVFVWSGPKTASGTLVEYGMMGYRIYSIATWRRVLSSKTNK